MPILGKENNDITKGFFRERKVLKALFNSDEKISAQTDLPPRGTGLLRGTARRGLGRGRGIPLSDEERRIRHERIYGK